MDGVFLPVMESLKLHLFYLLMVLVGIFAQDVGSTHLTKETFKIETIKDIYEAL